MKIQFKLLQYSLPTLFVGFWIVWYVIVRQGMIVYPLNNYLLWAYEVLSAGVITFSGFKLYSYAPKENKRVIKLNYLGVIYLVLGPLLALVGLGAVELIHSLSSLP